MSIKLTMRVLDLEKRLDERLDALEARLDALLEEKASVARGGGPDFTIPQRPGSLDELEAIRQRGRTAEGLRGGR